jgi:hypothetical protein
MLKALALTAAIGTFSALLVVDSGALPLAPAKQTVAQSDTVLVRDRCGRGMRYSERRHRCVATGPVGRIIREVVRPGRCGLGFHYSVRRGRCVPN